MILECPRCGGAIPADASSQYEDGECPRCRFVTPATEERDDETTTATNSAAPKALADGGREVSGR